MAEPAKEADQSMEDILQSIKRIIADEGEPAPVIPGSDVLELTELLAEDAAVPVVAAEPEKAGQDAIDALFAEPTPPPAPVVETPSAQDNIDALFAAPATPEPIAAEPEPVRAAPTPPVSEPLMSDTTLAASVAALNALAHRPEPTHTVLPGAAFRSGATVEDLVRESLKPMLKEWLDGNLPALVQSLVEKEIRRLSGN